MDQEMEEQRILLEEKRRHRVLKRTVWACLSFVILLIVVRVAWGLYSGHLLQAEIDRCHEAGEPILIEDFPVPEAIPDSENAAVLYRQAYSSFVKAETSWSDLYDVRAPSAHPDVVNSHLEKNAGVLELLRRARGLPVDWSVRFTSPMHNMRLPDLFGQRQLAKLAQIAAIAQFSSGDHSAAIETNFDLLELSAHLNCPQHEFIITHLTILAINNLAVESLEYVTPTLLIDDVASPRVVRRPATRQRVHDLIRRLLAEESIGESWKNAVMTDRASNLDTVQQITSGGVTLMNTPASMQERALLKSLQPMFELDAARVIRHVTCYCEAGLASNYTEALSLIPDLEFRDDASSTYNIAHIMQQVHFYSPSRALVLHFRTLTDRRMAATALAIRLYELDHGRRPESLAELVPDYLDAVPTDPFSPENKPLGYLPDADPPILYSVNRDCIDDGGAYTVLRHGKIDQEVKDLPFFLNGDRPRPPLEELPEENKAD